MATIQFASGQKVNFNGTPTPADVDYVAKQIGVTPDASPQQTPAAIPQQNQPAPQPKSLGQKILDVGTGVSNFIGGKGIADEFGATIARAANPKLAQNIDSPTVGQTVGSGLQVGSLLVAAPEAATTFAAEKLAQLGLSKGLSKIGARAIGGAATGYPFDVGANLQNQSKNPLAPGAVTALGAGLPLVPPAVGLAARGAGESLGITTGTGYGVIKEALQSASAGGERAKAFTDALRGKIAPEDIVNESKNSLGQIIQSRMQNYQSQLEKIAGDATSHDVSPIHDALLTNLQKFKVKPGQDGALDFSQSAIRFDRKAQSEVQTIYDEMRKFGTRPGDRTAVGLDSLKRAFGDLYSDSSNVRAFTTSMYNSANDVLKKNVPGYEKMSKDYAESTGVIKDIQKGLSLGNRAGTDQAFRKLTTALRTNNEFRKELIDELDKASGGFLSSKIAGQQLSEALPRGLARQIEGFGALGTVLAGGVPAFLGLAKVAALASPRIVGELVNALGISKRVFYDLLDKVGTKGAAPGDQFLKTPSGQAVKDYVKTAQPGLSMKDVSGKTPQPLPKAGGADAPFQGFNDITSKILDDLKGRTTVSKQYLLDALNRPEIKQAEKNIVRDLLKDEPNQVGVQRFAAKVKSELLPLERMQAGSGVSENGSMTPRYESINLPDELRGPVANYEENIYKSPIKTSAGNVHFGGNTDNYFAHTRVEDLPEKGEQRYLGDIAAGKKNLVRGATGDVNNGDTRRVIELQSDLFQKGRLEQEMPHVRQQANGKWGAFDSASQNPIGKQYDTQAEAVEAIRSSGMSKLDPYKNTWHERIIREEVKQAAEDGKTKLQFPTGETAMNIEGLVNRSDKWVTLDNKVVNGTNIKDGDLITYQDHDGEPHPDRRFLITKNNGDGTFDAVDNLTAENDSTLYDLVEKKGLLDDGRMPSLEELDDVGALGDKEIMTQLKKLSEHLSAKDTVDKENPIYQFYQKEVGKYLQKKYDAKLITDPQGVSWYEINVPKEKGKLPVEAFGLGAIPAAITAQQQQRQTKSTTPQLKPSRLR